MPLTNISEDPLESDYLAEGITDVVAFPNIDANEITDKGYINQRAVLERRNGLVETLFSDDAEVVLIT